MPKLNRYPDPGAVVRSDLFLGWNQQQARVVAARAGAMSRLAQGVVEVTVAQPGLYDVEVGIPWNMEEGLTAAEALAGAPDELTAEVRFESAVLPVSRVGGAWQDGSGETALTAGGVLVVKESNRAFMARFYTRGEVRRRYLVLGVGTTYCASALARPAWVCDVFKDLPEWSIIGSIVDGSPMVWAKPNGTGALPPLFFQVSRPFRVMPGQALKVVSGGNSPVLEWAETTPNAVVQDTDPTADNDADHGHLAGDVWINSVTHDVWICVGAEAGAWRKVTNG